MGKKNTIELNGKRYDAITGAFLGKARSASSMAMDFKKSVHHSHIGRSVDSSKGSVHHSDPTHAALKLKPSKPNKPFNNIESVKAISGHKPQPPKTLMRSVVRKPQIDMKKSLKVQTPADNGQSGLSKIPAKLSIGQVSPTMIQRAKVTPKSNQVNHFNSQASNVQSQQHHNTQQQHNSENNNRVETQDDDIFESAIAHATSHEQKAPKIKKHRSPMQKILNSLAILSACLVIAVFVAYLNMPNIELHFASARAGFHATLPGYKALGFSLNGPIKANNGIVEMSFQSGDSNFTLTQQASNWDNQTLLDSTTYQTDTPPKAVQTGGRTIYISQGNHATWVSGGIKYSLTGNSSLNPEQITSIADSM